MKINSREEYIDAVNEHGGLSHFTESGHLMSWEDNARITELCLEILRYENETNIRWYDKKTRRPLPEFAGEIMMWR